MIQSWTHANVNMTQPCHFSDCKVLQGGTMVAFSLSKSFAFSCPSRLVPAGCRHTPAARFQSFLDDGCGCRDSRRWIARDITRQIWTPGYDVGKRNIPQQKRWFWSTSVLGHHMSPHVTTFPPTGFKRAWKYMSSNWLMIELTYHKCHQLENLSGHTTQIHPDRQSHEDQHRSPWMTDDCPFWVTYFMTYDLPRQPESRHHSSMCAFLCVPSLVWCFTFGPSLRLFNCFAFKRWSEHVRKNLNFPQVLEV